MARRRREASDARWPSFAAGVAGDGAGVGAGCQAMACMAQGTGWALVSAEFRRGPQANRGIGVQAAGPGMAVAGVGRQHVHGIQSRRCQGRGARPPSFARLRLPLLGACAPPFPTSLSLSTPPSTAQARSPRRVAMAPLCFLALAGALLVSPAGARETSAVLATGNPHQAAGDAECPSKDLGIGECRCPAQTLDLSAANLVPRLRVQGDTFRGSEDRRLAGLELQLYHFQQPQRLSQLELPFKLLLLRRVDLADAELIEVPAKQALDSWFPGYAWSILVCRRCGCRHLGWKFTPSGLAPAEAFYAMIVETVEAQEEDPPRATSRLLASVRAVGQPLAAIGLAASALGGLSTK